MHTLTKTVKIGEKNLSGAITLKHFDRFFSQMLGIDRSCLNDLFSSITSKSIQENA